MNMKQTAAALKSAGYSVRRRKQRIVAENENSMVSVFFTDQTSKGKLAETALFNLYPLFGPSGRKGEGHRGGMNARAILPGMRAKEHRAAKAFSLLLPGVTVRECGVACTMFRNGKTVCKIS